MPTRDRDEPISDDEIVYRRVSEKSGWYDSASDLPVAWEAFRPNRNDLRGLSVWRARYRTTEEVAETGAKPGRRYFILCLRVRPLREAGVVVEPSPEDGGPGHASFVNMNASTYQQDRDSMRELAEKIAGDLVERVEGPFGPFDVRER